MANEEKKAYEAFTPTLCVKSDSRNTQTLVTTSCTVQTICLTDIMFKLYEYFGLMR
jgi:hypothetical protein